MLSSVTDSGTPALVVSAGEALIDFLEQQDGSWLARPGGAGWNVARALAKIGLPAAFAGGISDGPLGEPTLAASREAGLELRYLRRYSAPPLLAFVPFGPNPDYFFVGNGSADLLYQTEELQADLKNVALIHFGGISLARPPLTQRLTELAQRARASGVRISFDPNYRKLMDPSYRPTLERFCRLADLLKVSDEDLAGLFPELSPQQALQRLSEWMEGRPLVLTKGAEGAELHLGGSVWTLPAFKVAVRDTVGAGDALAAGLIASWLSESEAGWEAHLRFGLAAAAAACQHAGAYAPTLDDVAQLLRG
jgi:fructokinase